MTLRSVLLTLTLIAAANAQTLTAPPPPAPATNVSQAGTSQSSSYFYVVIANYPAGSAASQVVSLRNGNAVLSSTNYNVIGWQALPGVLTYDVLQVPNGIYTSSCTCSVATALAPSVTSFKDQGGMISSYTQSAGAQAAVGQIYLNNRDYAFPKSRIALNGADHLAENPSGNTLPAYCLVGDTFVVNSTSTLYLCGPTANTWVQAGGATLSVKGTTTGAVNSTVLATCPVSAVKLCQYAVTRSMQCTAGSAATGVGSIGPSLSWTDGFGSAGALAAGPPLNVATCAAASSTVTSIAAAPNTTVSYAVNAGTGTYSVDYLVTITRLQ